MQDIIDRTFGDRIRGTDIIFTPLNIVKDMIDLIPEEAWTPDIKVIDIYTKSGRFLKEIYKRLYESPYLAYMDETERRKHILSKQLYGLTDHHLAL